MAETILASASQKQVWMTKYFQEYVRLSGYRSFMSNADLNKGGVILSRYELQKEAGKTINVPFIGRLKSAGVTGSDVLDGQEEELNTELRADVIAGNAEGREAFARAYGRRGRNSLDAPIGVASFQAIQQGR